MSFPSIEWLPEGEQYNQFADPAAGIDPRYPLGKQGVMGYGEMKFRFGRAGGVALVAGTLQQAALNTANHVDLAVQAAAAKGATSIPVTLGGTNVSQDDYMDGRIITVLTPGDGYTYKISNHHPAGTASQTFSVPLHSGASVQVALTTSSKASLIRNPFRSTIITPASGPTASIVGVAVTALPINNWGWLQTFGTAAVLTSGTVVIGQTVVASTATAGAVMPSAAATSYPVGICQQVGANTESPIFLKLDG
jgi:hypothetical protein